MKIRQAAGGACLLVFGTISLKSLMVQAEAERLPMLRNLHPDSAGLQPLPGFSPGVNPGKSQRVDPGDAAEGAAPPSEQRAARSGELGGGPRRSTGGAAPVDDTTRQHGASLELEGALFPLVCPPTSNDCLLPGGQGSAVWMGKPGSCGGGQQPEDTRLGRCGPEGWPGSP